MLWLRWLVGLHLGPAADRAMTEMGQTQQTWANRAKCKLEAKLGPPEPLAILTTAMQSYDTMHEQYNAIQLLCNHTGIPSETFVLQKLSELHCISTSTF